ncbi:MAG: DNA-3-methyladenine glycosylase family protein [Acidimicrobiales bacterium]
MDGGPTSRAAAALAARDEVCAGLLSRFGAPRFGGRTKAGERFAVLARSICHQQLAGRAASTIHGRFQVAVGGVATPTSVLATPVEALRDAGLSASKVAAVRDLAEKVVDGVVSLDRIGRLDDEAVIDHLVQVRGIGRWTAEMFLLGTLGRLDVWPVGDHGVRVGFATAWGLPEVPDPADLVEHGERFRPYRSVVAWYCWKVVDNPTTVPT